MRIGSFGELVFEAGIERVLNWPALSRAVAANVEAHPIAGSHPVAEFIGPGEQTVAFEMTFSPQLGVDPRAETDRLIDYCDTGKRFPLIIGEEAIGGPGALWMVRELGEERAGVDNQGRTTLSRLNVTLLRAPNPPEIAASSGAVPKRGDVLLRRRTAA